MKLFNKWIFALSFVLFIAGCSNTSTNPVAETAEDNILLFNNHHSTSLLQFEMILKSLLNNDRSHDYTLGLIDQFDSNNIRLIAHVTLNNMEIPGNQRHNLLVLYDNIQDFVSNINPEEIEKIDKEKLNKMIILSEELRGIDVTKINYDESVKELNDLLD
ncbi:hypothetical protein [Rossellomorea aquimaris]|uniref:hypothetical protein n=1 Tax=Rossellomorea aquimaris TaxID=189382 RepID=UPI0007D08F3E|nr:hypothetical protein [Rossellomorea aquimaris]